MTRTRNTCLLSITLAFTLSACDSDSGKTETTATRKIETATATTSATTATVVKDPPPAAPKPDAPQADSPAGKVQLAAIVAKEISAAPELADEILSRHDLDRDKFDAIVYEIAGDPELTKAYMAARPGPLSRLGSDSRERDAAQAANRRTPTATRDGDVVLGYAACVWPSPPEPAK